MNEIKTLIMPSETPNTLMASFITTPIGDMLAIFTQKKLCLLEFCDQKNIMKEIQAIIKNQKAQGLIIHDNLELQQQINEYFSQQRQEFNINLHLIGTPFQQRVWQVLQTVPYGETRSYQTQAQILDNPKAIRAVASANGANKISIIIPCHRIIGSNGKLTGYAGGLERKKFLLDLEYQHKLEETHNV